MKAKKIAVCGLLAGLIAATIGLVDRFGDPIEAAEPTPAVSVASLDQIHGLAPIEDVVALFERRSAAQPLDYLSRTQLGAALAAQAREEADLAGYEMAEAAFRAALEINAIHNPAKLGLANALHSQHRFDEANALASEVALDDPSSLGALALFGDSSLELGDYDRAAETYEQLAAVDRSAPIISRLAQLEAAVGDQDRAIELAREALAASDDLALRPAAAAFYHFQMARLLFDNGQVNSAVAELEEALTLDPANPAATELLAFVSAATGDLDRAAELYEELVSGGGAPDLHGSYADVLRGLGHIEQAGVQEQLGLQLAAETIDRFPAERRHLVGFYLTRQPDVALQLAEADFAERQDIGAYDTLAWALYHNGQFAEADGLIGEALALGSDSAEINFHAGAIAAALGDDARAQEHLAAAIAINPSFHPNDADLARALLESLG